jgi:hypothetical protein
VLPTPGGLAVGEVVALDEGPHSNVAEASVCVGVN